MHRTRNKQNIPNIMKTQSVELRSVKQLCLLLLTLSAVFAPCNSEQKGCTFTKHKDDNDVLTNLIKPWLYKRYPVDDASSNYKYHIGICINAINSIGEGKAPDFTGVYQLNLKQPKNDKVIGKYSDASIIKGNDWLILEYGSGAPYTSHCGNEKRKARIMIACDESVAVGQERPVVVEEQRNKTGECYYLFELRTSSICSKESAVIGGLSIGSIIVIVFVCVVLLYLVLGFAYNRFVLGAKGMEQFPNYSFWQDFGNLQADGCNLVCRSGSTIEKKTYKGLGDDQLQEEEDRDDHLLPM